MTSPAQVIAPKMSVPSQTYYLINHVEELENFSLNKQFFNCYESFLNS